MHAIIILDKIEKKRQKKVPRQELSPGPENKNVWLELVLNLCNRKNKQVLMHWALKTHKMWVDTYIDNSPRVANVLKLFRKKSTA